MNNNILVSSLKYMYEEYKANIQNIYDLAIQNMYQQTLRTSLGTGWVLFRDLIYFGVFILFRFLMSGYGEIEGMNFVLFLMIGMVPWNIMGECINGGITAIRNNKAVISSIKFPIVILPTIEITAIVMKRLFTMVILLIVVAMFGDLKDVTVWMLIYYFFCMYILMVVWNLIFSSLVAISNDFEQLYRALTNVIFYTMPIIWSFESLGDKANIIRLFKLNPFVYVIEGFRDACVIGTFPDLQYSIYFWFIILVLLCIGSILQYKLKNHYIDLV